MRRTSYLLLGLLIARYVLARRHITLDLVERLRQVGF